MSRRIQFEDDNKDPSRPDITSDDDRKAKRKKQQKYEHEDTRADARHQTSAAPNEQVGAALPPAGDVPFADNSTRGLNVSGLQHGAANLIRNIAPDETPDRNTAVSATRFGFELGATAIAKIAVNAKNKRKSKLQNKDSSLQFSQSENAESPEQTANEMPTADMENEIENNLTTENNPEQEPISDAEPTDKSSDNVKIADKIGTDEVVNPSDGKTSNRLKFTKDEKAVKKLEKQVEIIDSKLEKAQEKLPTKTIKKKSLEFDENRGKTVTKLTHEKEKVPIEEAKWNQPKGKVLPVKVAGVASSIAASKIHAKVHQVEHENVGVKVGHKAELLAESGYRGAKQTAKNAYRFHKNRPYSRVAKLEQKSIQNKMKLEYKKALGDNPKLKSNPLSRFMQKRAIKRNYAKDLKAAKSAATTGKKTVGITAKVGKAVTAIVRKNPVFMVKVILLGLCIFLILSLFTMCVGIFSGSSSFVGASTYPAEIEDINSASILYTELETDLREYINDIELNHPGYDEYRFSIDSIGHDPFALMAFLSAVHHDFTLAEVEATIRAIFDAQYILTLTPEVEIRQREEIRTGTGSWTDEDGNTHTYTYTYTVIVEYEWHILNVNLTSRSFTDVALEFMDDDQTQHFNILMQSKGARQMFGNPFEFDWRPFMSSPFGYRIHPIHGDRRFHWGIDIGRPEGTPLLAALDGTVVSVGYQAGGYGNFVVIECEDGNQVRYAHCHEIFVSVGQPVSRGDVIATVGNTGASTGPHLHIEVSVGGIRINPIFFLDFR